MHVADRIRLHSVELVTLATTTVERAQLPHYAASEGGATATYLRDLLDVVAASLDEAKPLLMAEHADRLATERFLAGFKIEELLTAFNALETTLWLFLAASLPAEEALIELGRLGAVLGAGKDQIASRYVELATQRHAHGVDLAGLDAVL
ncbi:MAG: hypothetical protein V9G19_25370 [Tetrasphaera sp.]